MTNLKDGVDMKTVSTPTSIATDFANIIKVHGYLYVSTVRDFSTRLLLTGA